MRLNVQNLTLAAFCGLGLAGAVAVAVAAGGLGPGAALTGAALLAAGAWLGVVSGRMLSRPLAELERGAERLMRATAPSWRRTEPPGPDGTAHELATATARLRDRLDALTEERERAGQILDALAHGVLLLDGASRLLVANPAAREWLGLPADLRAGLPARRVVPVGRVIDLAEEAARQGTPLSDTVAVVFPSARTLSLRATTLADRGPTGRIVVTLVDVTSQHRIEALRRDFVANASHELKTPVAALRALAETMERALDGDLEAARRFAARIGHEAGRLEALVRDLLDLSRVERGTLAVEPVDLTALAKEVLGHHQQRAAERHVRLRATLEPGATVRGDRAQLGLLLSNLVDNALRHTPGGATVAVTLTSSPGGVTLEVTDRGPGIPAEELHRIFERFYRIDKARDRGSGGTGLGLAIVRHVAEAHGGTATVTSTPGEGSRFTVEIPC